MNETIFYFFYNLSHQSEIFDQVIIFFAVYFPYVVIFLAGIFLVMHHEIFKADSTLRIFLQKKKELMKAFFSGGLAVFITLILKFLIAAPRPFLALPDIQALFPETGYAFPSGHAAFFGALAFSIFFMHKKAGCIFMLFALLIDLARIAGGVHFPADILGGFIIGGAIAFLVKKL